METLDQILKHWEKDAVIDQTEPGKELLRIPTLHNKYLQILTQHRIALKKSKFDYSKLRRLKWEYYSGKMDEETLKNLGWEPFKYVLKSEIDTYLDSDSELIKYLEKRAYYEEAVSVCESIMNELKQRTWQLREYIAWERFIGGN